MMLNFIALLSVVFTSLVAATPVPGPNDVWTKYLPANDNFNSHNSSSPAISKRDVGPELNAGFYPGWNYCKSAPSDRTQCTLTFFDRKSSPTPKIWLFDNDCKVIGHNDAVPRAQLATVQGFGLSSEKPWYVDIHYRGEDLAATRDVSWWYNDQQIFPAQGGLYRKWQSGHSGMHHSNDDWAYRFAFNC